MIVLSVLNNSALLAKDEVGTEVVVVGKGIGFNKSQGDIVDESKVEKVFESSNKQAHELVSLLKYIPDEYFNDVTIIVRYANKKLKTELDRRIYITLTDHVYSAIERYNEGETLPFGTLNEMKHIYPDEYKVSEWIVDYLNATYDLNLPDDEIGFITVHIVAASFQDNDFSLVKKVVNLVNDITNLIESDYPISLEATDMTYSRFLTHLKFFAIRYLGKKQYEGNTNSYFHFDESAVSETEAVISKIDQFLLDKYGSNLSENEVDYLRLHLLRLKSE